MSDGGNAWWEDAVVYEVYPRSFADADGDGVGDLPGLRSRLGYLADLGVDAVWLTPFYPSPLADGGYDVSDYCAVDPLLGTMADFDHLVKDAAACRIRVIVDLVPNHCSSAHPLFRAALAAAPGSPERARFIFRDGRGPDLPPNNWISQFGGPAWTRVTEADGRPGQWYLHLYDPGQPDWDWRNPDIPALFQDVIRFWLERGVAGLRVDVAHGLFKDPDLPDLVGPSVLHAPSPFRHRPELQELYRTWRAILDSYPASGFPGSRTAIGEVWYDRPETLRPYLEPDGLPQVFNFQLILPGWQATAFRGAIDSALALTSGSRAPWVIGNHDVPRPASRYRLDEGYSPQTVARLIALGDRTPRPAPGARGRPPCCCSPCPARPTSTRARNSACPRSPTSRTERARIPGSAAPQARSPAATAAACPSPGPVPVKALASRGVPGHRGLGCPRGAECPPGLALPERMMVRAPPTPGCPSRRTGASTTSSRSWPTSARS